jgi:predicted Ser/Thr protein kinase
MTESYGKYQVLEFIGEGGFGRVFRGNDPVLKRAVAIKTCTLREPDMRERFVREAEIAANLRHPNIVTVYDFGEQDGEPYIVQEHLEGEDLDRKLKRGDALELATLVGWLREIAQGLLFAHGRGVVHRDVKPGNIRILPDGQVRIMDFGIAKLLQSERQLTQTGFSVGTTGYLAPEQLRGEEIDHRVDIFSFGVMAYELVAKRKPFEGDSITAILFRIAHEEPPPLLEIAPDCPPRLAAIIERCLRKEREDRFASFAPIIDELNVITRELAGGAAPAAAGATAAFQGGAPALPASAAAYTAGKPEEGGSFARAEEEPGPKRRLSPAAWGLVAATVAVAVFGVLNLSRLGQSSTGDTARRTRTDSIVPARNDSVPVLAHTDTADSAAAAGAGDTTTRAPRGGTEGETRGATQPAAQRGSQPGQRAEPPAGAGRATSTGAATTTERRQEVSATRVLLLVRSENGIVFDAAESTLNSELLKAGYQIVDAADAAEARGNPAVSSAQAGAIARLGQSLNAGSVLLIDATADARPITSAMFSGTAAVNVRFYDSVTGQVLGSERFEIGTSQVPGEPGPTASAAAAAAVRAASFRASRFVLPLLERLKNR